MRNTSSTTPVRRFHPTTTERIHSLGPATAQGLTIWWRSRRDSNPRYGFKPYNGLANRRLQPLGHSSVAEFQHSVRRNSNFLTVFVPGGKPRFFGGAAPFGTGPRAFAGVASFPSPPIASCVNTGAAGSLTGCVARY